MTWANILNRMRLYLRDPAPGTIWTDEELLQYYNDAAHEIAIKTGPMTRVETYNFPPEYDCSHTFDWETTYLEGTQYQALTINQVDGSIISYPWEHAYWLDVEPTADSGARCTHPFEIVMIDMPADVVEMPVHAKYAKAKLVCYDEEPIEPIDELTLLKQDGYYRTRMGKPTNYYLKDELQNRLIIFPRPSPVWDETEIYEVLDDAGGLKGNESWLDHQNQGITTDVISTADTLFMAYEALPVELLSLSDEPDFAPYVIKYVIYAALERAYSADTDGFIPSLRDYWGMRKKIGIEALKKWKRLSLSSRYYRLGGGINRIRGRHVKLPDHYPAVT